MITAFSVHKDLSNRFLALLDIIRMLRGKALVRNVNKGTIASSRTL